MGQRVFVKVVGFSGAERHALNTVFRLAEERQGSYALWTPEAPEPPALLLLDGESPDARAELQLPLGQQAKLIWVGANAPAQSWRVFQRPIVWPRVVYAIDSLFGQEANVDLDLGAETDAMDTQPPDTQPPEPVTEPRALVLSADRQQRLYLRARLALVGLTNVDEAENGGDAVELARRASYAVAIVEHRAPTVDGWFVLKRLRQPAPSRPAVILTKAHASIVDRLRAWAGGAAALLATPPDPSALDLALRRVAAASEQPAASLVLPIASR